MHAARRTDHSKRIASTMVLAILFLSAVVPAQAQVHSGTVAAPPAKIRLAIETARFGSLQAHKQRVPAPHAVQGQLRPATRGMLVAFGAAVGAVALGTAVGEAQQGDNALRGVVVGMPIGGLLGGLVTWRLTR
jgi:hypothetical protein